jgi:hypothetical protein
MMVLRAKRRNWLEIRDFRAGLRRAIPFLLGSRARRNMLDPIWDETVPCRHLYCPDEPGELRPRPDHKPLYLPNRNPGGVPPFSTAPMMFRMGGVGPIFGQWNHFVA